MKSFKNEKQLEKRLKRGICWEDYIKVDGKVFKMVEYGDGQYDNYMLFQNKTSKHMIEIRYQVPTAHYDRVTKERVEDKQYSFKEIYSYPCDELYRY